MKELDIKVGYQCNNACIFCLNKDKKSCAKFPFEDLAKQIESFAANGGEKLVISGGEPLISEHIFDLLTFAKQKGIKLLEVQTNARMLYYEEIVKKLKKFEPINFLVSFHFPNDKLYKKYIRSDGFSQTVGGIKNLVKYNCNFGTNTVIMKPNLPYLKGMAEILKKLGAKRIQYRFIDGKNTVNEYKKFVPRYKDGVSVIKEILKENGDIKISLREIPICVLGEKLIEHLSPRVNPERLNLTMNNTLVSSKEIESAQFVFPNCLGCAHKSICGGVRKEYVQIYGIKEFKPTTKK